MKMLLTFYKFVRKATDGKHTPPGLTVVNRFILICLVLGLGGAPIFAHAIRTMPAGVWIILIVGLTLRVALWFWRRRR
jgi:hypothetical protein